MNKLDFLVINGPNLNLLGIREPEIYGRMTYADLCRYIEEEAGRLGIFVSFFQSNHEGAIIDEIHSAYGKKDGIIILAGFVHETHKFPSYVLATPDKALSKEIICITVPF